MEREQAVDGHSEHGLTMGCPFTQTAQELFKAGRHVLRVEVQYEGTHGHLILTVQELPAGRKQVCAHGHKAMLKVVQARLLNGVALNQQRAVPTLFIPQGTRNDQATGQVP